MDVAVRWFAACLRICSIAAAPSAGAALLCVFMAVPAPAQNLTPILSAYAGQNQTVGPMWVGIAQGTFIVQRIVGRINPRVAQVDLKQLVNPQFVRNLEDSGFLPAARKKIPRS